MMTLEEAEAKNHPQGVFTKANVRIAVDCAETIWKLHSRSKKMQTGGEMNDLGLVLEAAYRAAPDDPPKS